jgi:hypothetical protein
LGTPPLAGPRNPWQRNRAEAFKERLSPARPTGPQCAIPRLDSIATLCGMRGTFDIEARHTGALTVFTRKPRLFLHSAVQLNIIVAENAALDKIGRIAFETKFNITVSDVVEQLNEFWRISSEFCL